MREIMLQNWTNSNMAGEECRRELYPMFNAGYCSIRGRQVNKYPSGKFILII